MLCRQIVSHPAWCQQTSGEDVGNMATSIMDQAAELARPELSAAGTTVTT
jgi:hypothetical protein